MVGAKFKLKVTLPVDKRWEKKARQLNVDSCQALRITAEFHLDSCQPKSPNKEKEKRRLFSTLKKREKTREISLSSFSRLVKYIYYSRKLVLFIWNKNPKNIRCFIRKGGPFLRFSKR